MATRTYKGRTIDRNINGDWIVTHKNGGHSQHSTLSEAKSCIQMNSDLEEYKSVQK